MGCDWMKIHTRDEGYNHEIEVEDRQMILSSAAFGDPSAAIGSKYWN